MSNVVKSIFFLLAVLSILVVGYLFQYIMTSADYGLLNNIQKFFHIKPVNWLGDSKIAQYSVLATQVWPWTGWSMVSTGLTNQLPCPPAMPKPGSWA